MNNGESADILVVEDNDDERASIVTALKAHISHVHVASAENGDEALDFLFSRGSWTHRIGLDPPRLILLDLALPGTDGFSVLAQIRALEQDDALTLTPVVIFTDSHNPGDVTKSYRCGANSYIIKPVSFLDFKTAVEAVAQYWMTFNRTAN